MTNFNNDAYLQAKAAEPQQPCDLRANPAHSGGLFMEAPHSELWSRNFGAPVTGLCLTADAALLAVACRNRTLTVLTRDCRPCWSQHFADELTCVAISATPCVAAGTQRASDGSGTVSVFDADGQALFSVPLASAPYDISLSADGERLVVLCQDQTQHIVTRSASGYELRQAEARHLEPAASSAASSHSASLLKIRERLLSVLDQDAGIVALHELPCTAVKCAVSHTGLAGIVALEDGSALLLEGDGLRQCEATAVVAAPGISSVAVSAGGTAVIGSPDGTLRLLNRQGKPLWACRAGGEVWAAGISQDGSFVVSGCTDGTVKLLVNHAHDSFNQHIDLLQMNAEQLADEAEQRDAAEALLAQLGQTGLIEYAVDWLNGGSLRLSQADREALAIKLLAEDVRLFPGHCTSHFLLAQAYQKRQEWHLAARHFTWAGQDDRMKLKSFTLAGESFLMAGHHFAAKSAFRRARELTVSEEAKKTLYTLGRIHQEQGSFAEAQKYYEVVFTLSPDYLDADARLQHLRRQGAQPDGLRPSDDKDWYASLILELLDPAAQRGFTPGTARATQLAGVAEQRGRLLSVIAEFALDKADKAADAALDYDVAAYMRYDCSVPEDEAKKSLELVNMLDCLKHYGPFRRSLDIGAATGRYPTLLARQGIQAFGVDLEPRAVEYARQKTGGALNPDFHQGDARALPFESTQFDLITCMMGTAAHFPRQDFSRVMSEIHRCLVPGGFCVISTWDIECPHLTYLSIYSHEQKELMRQNAISRGEASEIARAQGFAVEEIRPLGLLPESLGYELDLQQDGPARIRNLLDMDLALKAKFPSLHGQMYMLIIRKT
ncbi:methyltransferase domain-containing protein [Pseudomonas ekonensis]|nr:methyltransferase domain-containing protein [Pseudomonas ekonensis]